MDDNGVQGYHFYPRSPCGERPTIPTGPCTDLRISIHALLAESDDRQRKRHPHPLDFYPRSPCGERPHFCLCGTSAIRYFYPRSPCGERHQTTTNNGTTEAISIHALLAESDITTATHTTAATKFLSTLSLRRATRPPASRLLQQSNFYPRSPCGERHIATASKNKYLHFYPRSPCGERRGNRFSLVDVLPISIHALLAESDHPFCAPP